MTQPFCQRIFCRIFELGIKTICGKSVRSAPTSAKAQQSLNPLMHRCHFTGQLIKMKILSGSTPKCTPPQTHTLYIWLDFFIKMKRMRTELWRKALSCNGNESDGSSAPLSGSTSKFSPWHIPHLPITSIP